MHFVQLHVHDQKKTPIWLNMQTVVEIRPHTIGGSVITTLLTKDDDYLYVHETPLQIMELV